MRELYARAVAYRLVHLGEPDPEVDAEVAEAGGEEAWRAKTRQDGTAQLRAALVLREGDEARAEAEWDELVEEERGPIQRRADAAVLHSSA